MRNRRSEEAFQSIRGHLGALHHRILAMLRDGGPMTCEELEQRLGMKHQTCSPRILELYQLGLIEKSGQVRLTVSSRRADVWQIAGSVGPMRPQYQTYRCPQCGYVGPDPRFTHNALLVFCEHCGAEAAAITDHAS
jgi:helix-turn-helix protein